MSLQDLDVKGKKVLVRVDFNVPLNEDGTIADDTRIRESLPTIQYILDQGGSVVLMSHLGRPKGKVDPEFSLSPCARALSKLLKQDVILAEDAVGPSANRLAKNLKPGQVLLLENLRFYPAEEDPSSDETFAKKLASLGEIYVNDAFGTAHRAHSSTASIAQYFPKRAVGGFLMQKEIAAFDSLLAHPKRPFYAIIGGAKVSTKMGVLFSLLSKVDALFIGGGMAFTFLKAQGIDIGKSIVEEDLIPTAKKFLKECKVPLYFPSDIVIADQFKEDAHKKTIPSHQGIPDSWMGMDIGKETILNWQSKLQDAATVFWNGPLGVFEFSQFAKGTKSIAKLLASLNAVTVVGGGDSVSAINHMHLGSKFTHLSTGGGASLEMIEFGHLPGIDALKN